jgi:hypothetical protein
VTEFDQIGDLATILKKKVSGGRAPDATAKLKIIFGMATTMAHLHMRTNPASDLYIIVLLLNERWEHVLREFTFFLASDRAATL